MRTENGCRCADESRCDAKIGSSGRIDSEVMPFNANAETSEMYRGDAEGNKERGEWKPQPLSLAIRVMAAQVGDREVFYFSSTTIRLGCRAGQKQNKQGCGWENLADGPEHAAQKVNLGAGEWAASQPRGQNR